MSHFILLLLLLLGLLYFPNVELYGLPLFLFCSQHPVGILGTSRIILFYRFCFYFIFLALFTSSFQNLSPFCFFFSIYSYLKAVLHMRQLSVLKSFLFGTVLLKDSKSWMWIYYPRMYFKSSLNLINDRI